MDAFPIERHLHFRTVKSPQFGPGDESLYFQCDITGNQEVWEAPTSNRWPEQRTFTGRDVTFFAWSPTGEEMTFGMDSDGDERVQLYRFDAESETVSRLTDEPNVVHRWGGWNRDGSRFAYAANRRQRGVFDVYTQGVEDTCDHARLVYEQTRPAQVFPVGWSPENERLLVLEMHSNYNTDLHLVELDDGSSRLLTAGPERKIRYKAVRWGPDGESLYLITDLDHNWLYVARLDLESNRIEPVVQPDANVENMVFHRGRERIAYLKNDDGYSEVVAGQLETATDVDPFPETDLPTGAAKSLTMSSDGQRLATVYYRPDAKPDVYSIAIETGESTRWTDMSQPVPTDNYATPKSTTYESFDGLDVPSVYTEPDTSGEESHPAIISLHGGPRQRKVPVFDPVRQYYVEHGTV